MSGGGIIFPFVLQPRFYFLLLVFLFLPQSLLNFSHEGKITLLITTIVETMLSDSAAEIKTTEELRKIMETVSAQHREEIESPYPRRYPGEQTVH